MLEKGKEKEKQEGTYKKFIFLCCIMFYVLCFY